MAKLRQERLDRQKRRKTEELKVKMRNDRIKKEAEAEAKKEIMDEDAEAKLREIKEQEAKQKKMSLFQKGKSADL